jgi:5-hydroxyisourate hydrolase
MSDRVSISTHVLDTALGKPAAGIMVTLERIEASSQASIIARDVTNADGRVAALVPQGVTIEAGSYGLTFEVASYFATTQRQSFYRTIRIDFEVAMEAQHYHVPLLLNPFGYSTYRGS